MSTQTPDDDLPKTTLEAQPREFQGEVDGLASFAELLKAELKLVAFNKLLRAAAIDDPLASRKMLGRYLGMLEACDLIDAQLVGLKAADDVDDDPDGPVMGRDEDDDPEVYG